MPRSAQLSADIPAALAVFLVSVPLCLGIALASGVPLLAGLFAGMIGGIVVGALGRSPLSVSGPAAGLTVIVAQGIAELGTYAAFLTAVVLAGAMQVGLGALRAGVVVHIVPVCVVHGMLAAIGGILILKQIPHALGHDRDFEGDESFLIGQGGNTFSELVDAVRDIDPGALLIFLAALAAVLVWHRLGRRVAGPWLPEALIAVLVGTLVNLAFARWAPHLYVEGAAHRVTIPDLGHMRDIVFALPFPDPGALADATTWRIAATIAAIASVESLLSIGATDKLDPFHRITPVNRELKAQGAGNMISGLLGGLPITAVIVRSSVNIDAGARTRLATMLHGVLLLASVLVLAPVLNYIPLAALAAILIAVGARLISWPRIREQLRRGRTQFIPFLITLLAILFTDLLVGVLIGVGAGVAFVIRDNFRSAFVVTHEFDTILIRFAKDVSFLNKPALITAFEQVPAGSTVLIDGTRAQFIDRDIAEAIEDFAASASARKIVVEVRRSAGSLNDYFKEPSA